MEEVLKFVVLNESLRQSKRVGGAYTRPGGDPKNKGGKITLHFVGSQSEIRACDTWRVSPLPRTKKDKKCGRFHLRCEPTDESHTAERFWIKNGEFCFGMRTRCNNGPANNNKRHLRPVAQLVK